MNKIQELTYPNDAATLFTRIADRPWSIFLDSGPPDGDIGHYSLFSCNPWKTLETTGARTRVWEAGESVESREDPMQLLRKALGERTASPIPGIPFSGGAMGYFGYELGWRFAPKQGHRPSDLPMPDMAVGIYDWVVLSDHRRRRCWLLAAGRDPNTAEKWPELQRLFAETGGATGTVGPRAGKIQVNTPRGRYGELFRKVQDYIRAGDCYQVNLAMRFQTEPAADPWKLYQELRRTHPAPHAAFFRAPGGSVLSLSPERFLQLRGGRVRTCPIKGTRPRGETPEEDRKLLRQLVSSRKDRAENLMIVDLLRNDLGKTCLPGSVRVPELFTPRSYSSVHHLVSTVIGTLAPDRDGLDLLRECFPGGSITGAPKLRAMQIIEELEASRRGVYCGALAYLGYTGDMDSSIAIRTMVQTDKALYYWAGGGIVADSREDDEYQEVLDKAKAFFSMFRQGKAG